MSHAFIASSILLPSDEGPDKSIAQNTYTCEPIPERLQGLQRLNVFIGANNAGKSRLLRHMFQSKSLHFLPPPNGRSPFVAASQSHFEAVQEILSWATLSKSAREELTKTRSLALRRGLLLRGQLSAAAVNDIENPRELSYPDADSINRHGFWRDNQLLKSKYQYFHQAGSDFKKLVERLELGKRQVRRVYIPSVRGVRSLPPASEEGTDMYWKIIERDYQWKPELKDYVFTGQEMYNEVRSRLLGSLPNRQSIRRFEQFLARVFFSGQEVSLIPKEGKLPALWLKVGKEREYPLHHWGDGIQHVMTLVFPMFVYRDEPLMLFIEEPELYLHPGYQRILIDYVLSEPEVFRQVFVATHSHQFLDITIDTDSCAVFRCRKIVATTHEDENQATVSIRRVAGPDLEVLADLGVRNSSVLLSNCTVWVEGITDRIYYRHFLDLFQEQMSETAVRYKEDLHYSFVEYGGSNITHWSFLDAQSGIDVQRLCGELMLISDNDALKSKSRSEKKLERYKKLAATLGKRFVLLPVLEVENLLSPDTVRCVVEQLEKSEIPNWPRFAQASYRKVGLGSFITSGLEQAGYATTRRSQNPYEGESGTIKDKVAFCQAAVGQIRTYSDLSPDAKDVAKRIYDFITEKNR